MEWGAVAERQVARFEQARGDVLRGNAAYGAALALLMDGRRAEASDRFASAASSWRSSWAEATPTSWGRPIGIVKALLLAGDEQGAVDAAGWALSLGCAEAESPIGRYAAALAFLTLGRFDEAERAAASLRERDDFPRDVADALAAIASEDLDGYPAAIASVLGSFESRDAYLEDVPVADTVLVLQLLAARRGLAAELVPLHSPLLPG